jgi:hypothetical protein
VGHSVTDESVPASGVRSDVIGCFQTMRLIFGLGLLSLLPPVEAFQRSASERPAVSPPSEQRIAPARLNAAMVLSADYLERTCNPTGMFAYRVDIESGRLATSYNIVRHDGAVYALAMFNQSFPDRKATDAMIRAANFLRNRYIGLDRRSNELVVWSRPIPAKSETELGASGLGLVALTEARRVQPGAFRLEDMQSLGRFILTLQRPDGSFFPKYGPDRGPFDDPHDPQTLYYPGEAALGLISLYELDHAREWLMAAGKALSYLARSRANMRVLPPDHWALIATAKFLPYYGVAPSLASRAELIGHAARISERILHEQVTSADPTLDGSFDPAGWTTPAAIRLEGLLAAHEFLPDDSTGLRRRIEVAAQRGVTFLLHAQITTGPYAGGVPGMIRAAGALALKPNPAASEVRIDYVQHALSAWLRYQALIENHGSNHSPR